MSTIESEAERMCVCEARQAAFSDQMQVSAAAAERWLGDLLHLPGRVRCYSTDSSPSQQMKNKLSQANPATDGLMCLLLRDRETADQAARLLIEKWELNREWSKGVAGVALGHATSEGGFRLVACVRREDRPHLDTLVREFGLERHVAESSPAAGHAPAEESAPDALFGLDQALEGLFVERSEFESWIEELKRKKNLVLQGPPGVGKTFVARRLANAFVQTRWADAVVSIQLHQSYSYEDFVQGWRPDGAGGFGVEEGVFFRFCKRAQTDPCQRYVFLIDELNRGNLTKVFGELLTLLEADKRGPAHAMPLTYSKSGETFFVPENVHVIGLMNTADKSLSLVDYALRRRFSFVTLLPRFGHERFRAFLSARGAPVELVAHVVDRMQKLNETIREDVRRLGPGFEVGHSFFCPPEGEALAPEQWFGTILDREIGPLLREYWFDEPKRAEEEIQGLRWPVQGGA